MDSARSEQLPVIRPAGRRRPRWQVRLLDLFWPSATLALLLGGWELWVRAANAPIFVIAPPSDAMKSMVVHWRSYGFHTVVTTKEAALGFLLALGIGLVLALLIDASEKFAGFVYPLVVASQVFPIVALAPIMIVWFGYGLTPKLIIVCLFGVFVITMGAVTGFRDLQHEKIYLAQSMGAHPVSIFLKIKLPSALPNLFGGIKLAATLSIIGAVIAEFVGASAGLGYLLLAAYGNLDTPVLFGGIGYLTIMGIFVWSAASFLERLAIPWHVSHRPEVRTL